MNSWIEEVARFKDKPKSVINAKRISAFTVPYLAFIAVILLVTFWLMLDTFVKWIGTGETKNVSYWRYNYDELNYMGIYKAWIISSCVVYIIPCIIINIWAILMIIAIIKEKNKNMKLGFFASLSCIFGLHFLGLYLCSKYVTISTKT